MNEITIIIIGIFGMLIMALAVIIFVLLYQKRTIENQQAIKKLNEEKQQLLIIASLRSEDEERKRIAGEIHDDIGATLSTATLYMATAMQKPDTKTIAQAKILVDNSIQKLRAISQKLQPSILSYLGLQASISNLAKMIRESDSVQLQCHFEKPIPRYNEIIELHTYRIVQELLNNTIKYALPRNIAIDLRENDSKELLLHITHDGDGLDQELFQKMLFKEHSFGLKNISNRLSLLQAKIEFINEPAAASILVTVPTA